MEIGGGSDSSSKVIPESVVAAVKRTSSNIDEVKSNLEEFLFCCTNETLSRMEPLERAQALLLLAKATTTLFALRLRCKGVDPDDHPVKKEFVSLPFYFLVPISPFGEVERVPREIATMYGHEQRPPLRPSATMNPQAATRFIEHSLPDLSSEQKQSMRKISQGESPRINYLERNVQKKRKYQSYDKQSVRSAAQEFLEKAARELLGDGKNGVKGPLQSEDSDNDVIILD
ncbi:hypothetical protein OROGR_027031 [Orobanche gracilis]